MKKILFLAISTTVLLFAGCLWKQEKIGPLKIITTEQLKEKMAQEKDFTVINVLEKNSYTDCHIKDSINIPLNQLAEKAKFWVKDKAIVVYSASKACTASRKAFEMLKSKGFTNVTAYEEGMKEWKEKNFESEGTCK